MANNAKLRKILAEKIYEQLGLCFYCGIQMQPKEKTTGTHPTLDHIVPASFKTFGYYNRSNLVAACYSCNTRKGNNSLEWYLNTKYLARKIQNLKNYGQ
jgi:5-methylcytosine-specific restriction endonuclease McrA